MEHQQQSAGPNSNQQQQGKPPRKRRSNKQKAESQFNASAAPKTLEKFFSDVIEEQRENVDIELHLDIDQRLVDGYDDKIDSYIQLQPYDQVKSEQMSTDRTSDLMAMTNLAVAKKLWTSTPDSEKTAVDHLKYIRNYNVDLPKSMNIAIEHLGKVTDNDWICRIRWNSLTIERFIFRSLQYASTNKDFASIYLSKLDDLNIFQNTNVDQLVTTSNDSVNWLRNYAQIGLEKIQSEEFEVKIGDGNDKILVCLPQLRFSEDRKTDRANILAWMNKINVNYPKWKEAIGGCALRLITPDWLDKRKSPLKDLDPIFQDSLWAETTLEFVFKEFGLVHISDIKGLKLRDMSGSFLFYYQKTSLPFLKRAFNISNASSSSSFGSPSQLIILDSQQFEVLKKKNHQVNLVKSSAEGSSMFRIKDKSSIVHNMIYGFTKAVRVRENYKYRTNGNSDSIKSSNISNDFRD